MTQLNSASTQKGADVEAVLSRPLVNDGKLIVPQGSVLKGSVVQVQPARHWKHNGQLRFVFRDLVLPNGVKSKVEAMVQGVQAGAADNLQLDAEGGAQTKTSKTRYLRSGIAVGLAAATHEDEPLNRAEGGAGGFKVVGTVIGATVHSQPLAIAMGAIGAGRSIYSNFIARGTDVVFAKHTAMERCRYARCCARGHCESGKQQQSSLTHKGLVVFRLTEVESQRYPTCPYHLT
jgi:hypothetical protein